MAVSRGKQWEEKVKEDLSKLMDVSLERVPDQVSGFKNTSQNPCDFYCYLYPYFYYIEAKSVNANTFSLDFPQYERLLIRAGRKGVRSGVMLWWIPHQKVAYIPVKSMEKMKQDGKKSVNIKMLNTNEYRLFEIPSITKRILPTCDYNILRHLQEGD